MLNQFFQRENTGFNIGLADVPTDSRFFADYG